MRQEATSRACRSSHRPLLATRDRTQGDDPISRDLRIDQRMASMRTRWLRGSCQTEASCPSACRIPAPARKIASRCDELATPRQDLINCIAKKAFADVHPACPAAHSAPRDGWLCSRDQTPRCSLLPASFYGWPTAHQGSPNVAIRSMPQTNKTRFSSIAGSRSP